MGAVKLVIIQLALCNVVCDNFVFVAFHLCSGSIGSIINT